MRGATPGLRAKESRPARAGHQCRDNRLIEDGHKPGTDGLQGMGSMRYIEPAQGEFKPWERALIQGWSVPGKVCLLELRAMRDLCGQSGDRRGWVGQPAG